MFRLLLTIALALNVAAIPTSGDVANPNLQRSILELSLIHI